MVIGPKRHWRSRPWPTACAAHASTAVLTNGNTARYLRNRLAGGEGTDRAKPLVIVSLDLPLEKVPEGYGHFDARDDDWTKVVLKPTA